MSLINKMLQDLDRRQALGAGATAAVTRPAAAPPEGREWFWRTLTALLLISVAWVVWVSLQLLPRPLVPDDVLAALTQAPGGAATQAAAEPPAPAPRAEPAAPAPEPPAVASPPPAPLPPLADTLKLAQQIETPIREPVKTAAPPAPPAQPKVSPPKKQAAAPAMVPAATRGVVDKRDRNRSAYDIAQSHFQRAVLFLSHGRVSEAEPELAAALRVDPAHVAARQAYVALLLEQQRLDPARRLLEEAVAIDASQANFVLTLARLHAERKDYKAALALLEGAGPNASNADFQALRAAVLQRVGRHAEAVQAYQNAVQGDPYPGTTWVGLGISLEALGRRAEAATAYRKALEVGPLAAEARAYATARARALD